MPRFPKSSKTSNKKTFKKSPMSKKKNYKTINTVNRSLNPIPQRYITKLKYATTTTLSSLITSWRYNLNSLYDPDRTGGGHQPYGFDQLAGLYNRYRVIGCHYRIECYNTGGTIVKLVAVPSNEEFYPSDAQHAIETSRARYIVQAPGASVQQLQGYVSIPSLVGRTKSQYMADDRFQSDVGSSPLELAILNLYNADITGVAQDGSRIAITLEYTAEFFDIKTQSQS